MTLETTALLHSRYRIEDTISAGGMGAVYRALDETLGISVAVKENFFYTEEHSRQFRREATILASLRHPNLPRVTDHFVIPGQGQYLVMDFIEGVDLREVITRNGSLAEEECRRVGVAICDALIYLHSRNPAIVHRDIKPGNIKITSSGHVFLVDFGLAKIAQGEDTTTGAQALTPGYAPPEQYGQGTEPRSDIYALGATLYAALTGKIPEDGLSRLMGAAELTPIRRHTPGVSARLARVIERAMAVSLDDRYPSADSFRTALREAAQQPQAEGLPENYPPVRQVSIPPQLKLPIQTPERIPAELMARRDAPAVIETSAIKQAAPRQDLLRQELPGQKLADQRLPRKRSTPWIVLPGIAGLVVLVAAALVFGPGFLKTQLAMLPAPTTTAVPALLPTATFPPADNPTRTLPPPPTATPAPLPTLPATQTPAPTATGTAAVEATVAFTPTQAATALGGAVGQIAFASQQDGQTQVWVIDTNGSALRQVTHLPDGACQPDWSPDGKRLVFISPCPGMKDSYPGASLFIISADGTDLTPLATLPGGDFDPAWSPDGYGTGGGAIAFTSLRENNIPHIYLYNLADDSVTRLSSPVNRERRPAWSPDGKLLAYETTRLAQPQIWTVSASGKGAREFTTLSSANDSSPTWSPDGSVIVFTQGNQPILVARQVGDRTAQQFPVSDRCRPVEDPRFSPDGWWLAFTCKQDGNTDIYLIARNGANLTRLTTAPGDDFHPAWRP